MKTKKQKMIPLVVFIIIMSWSFSMPAFSQAIIRTTPIVDAATATSTGLDTSKLKTLQRTFTKTFSSVPAATTLETRTITITSRSFGTATLKSIDPLNAKEAKTAERKAKHITKILTHSPVIEIKRTAKKMADKSGEAQSLDRPDNKILDL